MSSVLGRMLNLDFEDQFDAEDSSTSNVYVEDSSSINVNADNSSSTNHKCQLSGRDDTTCYASENGIQDEEHNVEILAENTSDGRNDTSPELPPVKHGRKHLLNAVVKGTAIVGVLFFLLHVRSRGDNAKDTVPFDQTQKFGSSKFSSTKQRKEGRMSGIYPAEKLKFGN
ncbi:unnamed protein product [Fraxinus pennsylvanica]|uniref:Uncharacterized protein n=1 Tax=Fraxinus pennsylvanica TaxID=56036 RepID=A0AAD1YL32_9LAMI|nr:unnamed protein product [Fraxinus pennsylvanica]